MGVLALGIGFGTRWRSPASCSTSPATARQGARLLRRDPAAAPGPGARRGRRRAASPATQPRRPRRRWRSASSSLAGLPPSPLFVSELMILLGGIDAGLLAVSAIAAVLLALGFLGLAHALIEGLLGETAQAAAPAQPALGARGRRCSPRPRPWRCSR